MTAPAIGHAANLLAELALEIPGPPDAAEAGTRRVRLRSVILWRHLPLDTLAGERRFDRLLTIRGPHRRDRREAVRRRCACVLDFAPHVDALAIAQRPEADADDVHAAPLRLQEIDVAIARDGHEAARDRRVFQRQLVDA